MGGETRDIKEFLYAFLMKRYRIPPVYDVRPIGKFFNAACIFKSFAFHVLFCYFTGDNRGFYCELKVQGIKKFLK